MKIAITTTALLTASVQAFTPTPAFTFTKSIISSATSSALYNNGMDLSGNDWKPGT